MNTGKSKVNPDNLQQDLSLYRRIFTTSYDCIAILNSEGEYVEQNAAHQKLFGLSDFDIMGETPSVIFGEERFKRIMDRLKEKGAYTGEVSVVDKNSAELTTTLSAFALRKNILKPANYFYILRKITKGENVDEELKKSEHKYRQLIENSLQAIVIIQDFKIVYTNKSFSRITGYTIDELLSFTPKETMNLVHPDDQEMVWGNLKKRIIGLDIPPHYQFKGVSKDGSTKILDLYVSKTDFEGKPAIQGFFLDITDQVAAQQALEKSDQNYKILIENQTDLIIKVDPEGRFLFVSPSYCELFGKKEEELLGKYFLPLVHEEDRKKTEDAMERLKEPPHSCYIEQRALTSKGWRWLAWFDQALVNKNGKITAVIGSGRDIDELKKAENNLRERNKYIETILRNLPIGLAVHEINSGKLIFMNKEFQEIYGWPEEEIPTVKTFLNKVYPDAELRKNISSKITADIKGKKPENLFWDNIEVKSKNGEKKYVSAKNIPLYDQNLIISTVQDITKRITADRQIQNSLKEKEILLREIHHRVKNNLQTISSLLDLQAESIKDSAALEAFRSSQSRIRSMALIHERLYKSESLSRIKAQEYIKNLTDYLEATYDSRAGNIKLTTNVQNILLNLDTAIPCGLIINELVSNSMKYAFPGEQVGTIEVSLLVSSADSISLSVKDDGIGIPTDITIENSPSLGLQLVHLLAKQIYGTLKTERKNGTRVEIIFPKPAVFEEIIGE